MVYLAGDAEPPAIISAPSSRGLGRRPLKAVTPVRIRSGLLGTRVPARRKRESGALVAFTPGDDPPDPPMRGLRPARRAVLRVTARLAARVRGLGHRWTPVSARRPARRWRRHGVSGRVETPRVVRPSRKSWTPTAASRMLSSREKTSSRSRAPGRARGEEQRDTASMIAMRANAPATSQRPLQLRRTATPRARRRPRAGSPRRAAAWRGTRWQRVRRVGVLAVRRSAAWSAGSARSKWMPSTMHRA